MTHLTELFLISPLKGPFLFSSLCRFFQCVSGERNAASETDVREEREGRTPLANSLGYASLSLTLSHEEGRKELAK